MSQLKIPVTEKDHIQGLKSAPVTLVEYGDYECPYCGQAYIVVKRLQEKFGKQLRFVFRNLPLSDIHPHALAAANAAEFAAEQKKFWPMHDLLFENQADLSLRAILELGGALKVPQEALKAAIQKGAYDKKIKKELLGGIQSGVKGTPTFFINGLQHTGPFDFEYLAKAIESS